MEFHLSEEYGVVEDQVRTYWEEADAYRRAQADADEVFYFLDGPPNPSGRTHLGTVWNKILKDVVLRTARMSGYSVVDTPGYDTHLFTTEQRVAAERGLDSPADVESAGVADFERECERFEAGHVDQLGVDFRSYGVWMDWDDAYRTDSPEYADAAWWTFAEMYDAETVERREQVTDWCPHCERALFKRSEVETEHLSHREPLRDESSAVYVAYPLADEDASVLTRAESPWRTLLNTFLTVDPGREYVRVDHDEYGALYAAADQWEGVLLSRDGSLRPGERVTGEYFLDRGYDHALAECFADPADRALACPVVADDGAETATGFGHGTPACDERDRQLALENGLAVFDPLTDDGTLDATAGPFSGARLASSSLDERVVEALDERRASVRRGESARPTRQCWLCGSAVVPRITRQWYVTLSELADELAATVAATEWIPDGLEDRMRLPSAWHPDWSRDRRFAASADENQDWLVQQHAHWGLPMPVWVAEDDPEDVVVVRSRAELADRADQSLDPAAVRPRRSALDDVTITEGGTTYRRVSAVFADRFTAALAAVAVAGPPDGDGRFDGRWPVDLVIEARDQPGLWFFMQLAVGVAAFGEMPFQRAFMHGFLTDESGEKMSKSVGNVVTPDEARDRYSADATRLYLLANTDPDTDLSLDWEEIGAIESALERLLDACRTANRLREREQHGDESTATEEILHAWVDEQFEAAADTAADEIASLSFSDAASAVLTFVDETVSGAYVPLLAAVAERNGLSAASCDRLERVLEDTARLLAPHAPHIAEAVYQCVDGEAATVHATACPLDRSPASAWRGPPPSE